MQQNYEFLVEQPLSLPDRPTIKVGDKVTSADLVGVEVGRLVAIKCLRPLRAIRGSVTRATTATREELQEEVERLQSVAFGPAGGTRAAAPKSRIKLGGIDYPQGVEDPVKPPADLADDDEYNLDADGRLAGVKYGDGELEASTQIVLGKLDELREAIGEDFRAIVRGIVDSISDAAGESLRKENESLKQDLRAAQDAVAQLREKVSDAEPSPAEEPPKPTPKVVHKPSGK